MRLVSLIRCCMGRPSGGVREALRGWTRYQTGKQIGAMRQQGRAGFDEIVKLRNRLIYSMKMRSASTVAGTGHPVFQLGVGVPPLSPGRGVGGEGARSRRVPTGGPMRVSSPHPNPSPGGRGAWSRTAPLRRHAALECKDEFPDFGRCPVAKAGAGVSKDELMKLLIRWSLVRFQHGPPSESLRLRDSSYGRLPSRHKVLCPTKSGAELCGSGR